MAEETQTKARQFEEEFKALPLEDKFCSLFRMEAATFEQTIREVVKTGGEVFEKVGVALNDFSEKVQQEFNKERQAATDYAPPVTDDAAAEAEPAESNTPGNGVRKKK